MQIFISVFIIILNIVAFMTVMKFARGLDIKGKVTIFVVMYLAVYFIVSWIFNGASNEIGNELLKNASKYYMVFSIVPINLILASPIIVKEIANYVDSNKKDNKGISFVKVIMIIVLIIVTFIFEYNYIKISQANTVSLYEKMNENIQDDISNVID